MEPVKAPAPLVIISSSPYIHCGSTISGAQRYPYLLPLGCHLRSVMSKAHAEADYRR